ncbi:MAG: DNA topoisomerase IB [Fulvivirga sp.]
MAPQNSCPPKLLYVSDDEPGFIRQRWGRGFIYRDLEGKRVTDEKLIRRIKKLVIHPMWNHVWICTKEKGHLQVTGQDLKGRKQYLYHPEWSQYRQETKYNKLVEFGRKLPVIRKRLMEHIELRGWPKERILALIVMILDEHYIRIGNKHYEHENQTYGLTTMRRKHLSQKNGKLFLSYKAKSGKYREVQVHSKKLVRLIKKISELPGYEIFKYQDEMKNSHPLDSNDVNRYLEEISGEYFTAKNFRTWGGTVLAIDHYEAVMKAVKENPRLNLETNLVKRVAETLGNTVATCRAYYIHPKVLEAIVNDEIAKYKKLPVPALKFGSMLSYNEKLVLKIIGSG